jgi:hypothetical protein
MPKDAKKILVVEEQTAPAVPVEPEVIAPITEIKPEVKPEVIPEVKPEPIAEKTVNEVSVPTGLGLSDGMEMEEKRTFPRWLIFGIGLLIGGALGAGLVWGLNTYGIIGTTNQASTEKVIATPTGVLASPVPTTVALSRSNLKIRVENGSGVRGAAAVASDFLTNLGYKVVSVGNADENVKTTQVSLSLTKAAYFDMLAGDLKGKYEVATQASEFSTNEDYDALVVVNK